MAISYWLFTAPVAVEFVSIKAVAITAGTVTIDLTAAEKSAGRTQDLTGKKLIGMIAECPAANSGVANIAPGSANPYPLTASNWVMKKVVIITLYNMCPHYLGNINDLAYVRRASFSAHNMRASG